MKTRARLFAPVSFFTVIILAGIARSDRRGASILSMDSVQAVPGSEVDVYLRGKLDNPIRGFQVGVEYPQFALSLLSITLDGTALTQRPDIFQPTITQGLATVKVIAP